MIPELIVPQVQLADHIMKFRYVAGVPVIGNTPDEFTAFAVKGIEKGVVRNK